MSYLSYLLLTNIHLADTEEMRIIMFDVIIMLFIHHIMMEELLVV